MRMWRNWQTRTVQVRVSNIVKVRILSSAPKMGSRKRLPKYYGALAQLGARLTGSQEVTSSSLVRSTIQTLGIPRVFAFFWAVGFGWMETRTHDTPKALKLQHYILGTSQIND